MKISLLIYLIVCCQFLFAQEQPVGVFQKHNDIGNPRHKGNAGYNQLTQTYTLTGGGYNIWFNRDEFQYLFSKMKGDFILTASFEFVGTGGNNHRKYGWMLRESENDDAAHVSAVAHGDGLTVMQWRVLRGAYMRDPQDELFFPKKGAQVIQLQRTGKDITMRAAHFGEPLQEVGTYSAALPDALLAGPFICSHDSAATERVNIWNVRIDRPVAKETTLQKRYETVQIADGKRKILAQAPPVVDTKKNDKSGYQSNDYSGTWQIYKTKTDGTGMQQITFDQYHNIAPAVSLDGKWLAFVSLAADSKPTDIFAPATIRLLPLTGGAPKVIGYYIANREDTLHWSSDSVSVSFMSYGENQE